MPFKFQRNQIMFLCSRRKHYKRGPTGVYHRIGPRTLHSESYKSGALHTVMLLHRNGCGDTKAQPSKIYITTSLFTTKDCTGKQYRNIAARAPGTVPGRTGVSTTARQMPMGCLPPPGKCISRGVYHRLKTVICLP